MHITRLKIESYSSFADSGWITLDRGFNLVIGQNNTGKSSLLKSLRHPLEDLRHVSSAESRYTRLPPSRLFIDLTLSSNELQSAFLEKGGDVYWGISSKNTSDFRTVQNFVFQIFKVAGNAFQSSVYPPHGLFQESGKRISIFKTDAGEVVYANEGQADDNTPEFVNYYFNSRTFVFDAQRFNLGRCHSSTDPTRLEPQATNLPAVLNELQGRRRQIFNRLNQYLREIFPTVDSISVSTLPQSRDQFVVWTWPTNDTSRDERGFELNSSGTGLAQVIAILAVVLTLDAAIIVIDEINAFLHPSAVKSLLRILRTYHSDHQYIVSAHSSEVLSAAMASTVHLVRRRGFESSVVQQDISKLSTLRGVANELGISVSDVFGADRIIWVEGATEALCFPYLYNELIGTLPRGVCFSPVSSTGDFGERKTRAKRVIDIYQTISKNVNPLIEQVAFGFDRELITDAQAEEIEKQCDDQLMLLPRRCIEAYLINPSAIRLLIIENIPGLEYISEDDVRTEILDLGRDRKLGSPPNWTGNLDDERWLKSIDAARLLDRTITNLTDAKLKYDKVKHGLALLKTIRKTKPDSLSSLVEYISRLMRLVTSVDVKSVSLSLPT